MTTFKKTILALAVSGVTVASMSAQANGTIKRDQTMKADGESYQIYQGAFYNATRQLNENGEVIRDEQGEPTYLLIDKQTNNKDIKINTQQLTDRGFFPTDRENSNVFGIEVDADNRLNNAINEGNIDIDLSSIKQNPDKEVWAVGFHTSSDRENPNNQTIGSIINKGNIKVVGPTASGIVAGINTKHVENSGNIFAKATGHLPNETDASGVELRGTASLLNTGSIKAETPTGQYAYGVYVYDRDFEEDELPSGFVNSIINKGTIEVTHRGGSNYPDGAAIQGNEKTTLEMGDNSKIIGDIFGVKTITVTGNASFDGERISSRSDRSDFEASQGSSITINKGARLELFATQDPGDDIDFMVDTLEVKGGATLALNLTKEMVANRDDLENEILDVSGKVIFRQGSTVEISAKEVLDVEKTSFVLVESNGGMTDEGVEVKGTLLLKVDDFFFEEEEGDHGRTEYRLIAKVSVANDEEIVEKLVQHGASGNARAAGREINNLLENLKASENSALRQFANAIGDIKDPRQLAQVAEQMVADVDGGAVQAVNSGQALITNVTSGRTTALRGQSSGVALSNAGVWVQGLYNDARQATRDNVAGYSAHTSGIAVGADAKVTDNLTLGAAYSYMDSTVNSKRGNKTDVDGHAFTVYGGFEQGNYFVDGNLTFSKNENKSKRHILNTVAKGKYDSKALGLSVLGGYDFQLEHSLTATPLAGLRYSNVKIDSFTEKGSPAALRNGKQRYEMAELGLGGRLSANYPLGQGRLQPQVQAMVYHDFAADRVKTTSSFANVVGGNSFVAHGAKPVRTSYEANIGADYKLGAFTVGASYGYAGKSGFNSDTFAAKVRYDF